MKRRDERYIKADPEEVEIFAATANIADLAQAWLKEHGNEPIRAIMFVAAIGNDDDAIFCAGDVADSAYLLNLVTQRLKGLITDG